MRRTEHGDSWIESRPDPLAGDAGDHRCDLCKREPAEDVQRLVYSRNGWQQHGLSACRDCRMDLIHHLSARE